MHLSKRLALTIVTIGTALSLAACAGSPSSTLTDEGDCAITTNGGIVQNNSIAPTFAGLTTCTTDTEHLWVALTSPLPRTTQSSGRPVKAFNGLQLIPASKVVPDGNGSFRTDSQPVPAVYGTAWTLFVTNQHLSDKLAVAKQGEIVTIGDGDAAMVLVQTGSVS